MEIHDLNYERFIADQTVPVMFVFMASFCGPTAAMEEQIEQVTADFEGRVVVATIDVEKCPNITRQFAVKGTPSMVVLNMGVPVASRIGTSSMEDLTEWVAKAICKQPPEPA